MSDWSSIEHSKLGNPYPAIYREREALRRTFVRACLESPLLELRRIEQHAMREFMGMSRALSLSWHRTPEDAKPAAANVAGKSL